MTMEILTATIAMVHCSFAYFLDGSLLKYNNNNNICNNNYDGQLILQYLLRGHNRRVLTTDEMQGWVIESHLRAESNRRIDDYNITIIIPVI